MEATPPASRTMGRGHHRRLRAHDQGAASRHHVVNGVTKYTLARPPKSRRVARSRWDSRQSRVGERLLPADGRRAVGARRVPAWSHRAGDDRSARRARGDADVRALRQRRRRRLGSRRSGTSTRSACCSPHARRSRSRTATRSACAPIPARTPGSCNRARRASPFSRSRFRSDFVHPTSSNRGPTDGCKELLRSDQGRAGVDRRARCHGDGRGEDALNAITRPHLAQALITPGEIRSDGKTAIPRLGTQAGDATLPADLRYTEHDPYLEAALRGTWATDTLVPGLTRRSYTIETYEQDIDTSVLSKGLPVRRVPPGGAPDEPAHIEYPGMFIKQRCSDRGLAVLHHADRRHDRDDGLHGLRDRGRRSPVLDLTASISPSTTGSRSRRWSAPRTRPTCTRTTHRHRVPVRIRSSAARQSCLPRGDAVQVRGHVLRPGWEPDDLHLVPQPARLQLLAAARQRRSPGRDSLPVVGGVVGADEMIQIERTADRDPSAPPLLRS
jgi:hypothetical protein